MLLADAESCYSEGGPPASRSVTPSLSPSPPPPLPPQASTAARWTDCVPPRCQRCRRYTMSLNKGECASGGVRDRGRYTEQRGPIGPALINLHCFVIQFTGILNWD